MHALARYWICVNLSGLFSTLNCAPHDSAYPLVTRAVQQPVWVVRLAGLLLCYAAEISTHVLMAAGLVPLSIATSKFMHSAVGSDVLSTVRALQMRVSFILVLLLPLLMVGLACVCWAGLFWSNKHQLYFCHVPCSGIA